MDIRDTLITGSFMIGEDGKKEPTDWKNYALRIESIIGGIEDFGMAALYLQNEVITLKERVGGFDKSIENAKNEKQKAFFEKGKANVIGWANEFEAASMLLNRISAIAVGTTKLQTPNSKP